MVNKPKLHKVTRVRVFEGAVHQIRDAIMKGEFRSGERLPTEAELSSLFDVGRSTVREAIRVLEAEGLIEVRRGAGMFVRERSFLGATRGEILGWLSQQEDSVLQIMDVRIGIEWLTASLAAAQCGDELTQALRDIIAAQWEAANDPDGPDVETLAALDVQFHTTISEASGNAVAHEIVSHILPAFAEANQAMLWVGKNIPDSIREHEAILAGIEAQNVSGAEKAMRAQLERVKDDIERYLAAEGE